MEGKDPVTRLEWMAVRLGEVHRYFPEWADRVGLIGLSSYLETDGRPGVASEVPIADAPGGVRAAPRVRFGWRAWRMRRR